MWIPATFADVQFGSSMLRRPRSCESISNVPDVVESRVRRSAMPVLYEVWDYETRNLINSFETEAAAVAFLRRQLDLNGQDAVRELAIVRQTPDASGEFESELILEGPEIVRRFGTTSRSPDPHVDARRVASVEPA
jgi:hypothetical protein